MINGGEEFGVGFSGVDFSAWNPKGVRELGIKQVLLLSPHPRLFDGQEKTCQAYIVGTKQRLFGAKERIDLSLFRYVVLLGWSLACIYYDRYRGNYPQSTRFMKRPTLNARKLRKNKKKGKPQFQISSLLNCYLDKD
jgi:hypothetical protein